MIQATPQTGCGALALPVEDGHWLIVAVGTVAACQALLIRDALKHDSSRAERGPLETRRLQRRIGAAADFPWKVATTEDLRHPSSSGSQPRVQRFLGLWTTQLARLAAHGDRGAYLAFARVYHLMAAPAMLFHPSLAFSACRAAVRGMPEQNPRPRALDALMRSRSA